MKLQQGDVILKKTSEKIKGKKLKHLVLAEGEKTGHSHQIISNVILLKKLLPGEMGKLFMKSHRY